MVKKTVPPSSKKAKDSKHMANPPSFSGRKPMPVSSKRGAVSPAQQPLSTRGAPPSVARKPLPPTQESEKDRFTHKEKPVSVSVKGPDDPRSAIQPSPGSKADIERALAQLEALEKQYGAENLRKMRSERAASVHLKEYKKNIEELKVIALNVQYVCECIDNALVLIRQAGVSEPIEHFEITKGIVETFRNTHLIGKVASSSGPSSAIVAKPNSDLQQTILTILESGPKALDEIVENAESTKGKVRAQLGLMRDDGRVGTQGAKRSMKYVLMTYPNGQPESGAASRTVEWEEGEDYETEEAEEGEG
jgi:hypothetical protein